MVWGDLRTTLVSFSVLKLDYLGLEGNDGRKVCLLYTSDAADEHRDV